MLHGERKITIQYRVSGSKINVITKKVTVIVKDPRRALSDFVSVLVK